MFKCAKPVVDSAHETADDDDEVDVQEPVESAYQLDGVDIGVEEADVVRAVLSEEEHGEGGEDGAEGEEAEDGLADLALLEAEGAEGEGQDILGPFQQDDGLRSRLHP